MEPHAIVITALVAALFLIPVILHFTLGQKPKLPKGKKAEYHCKDFESLAISPTMNKEVLQKLARMCAISMFALNKMIKKYDIKKLKGNVPKFVLFHFLDDIAYEAECKKDGASLKSTAYAWEFGTKMNIFGAKKFYKCVIRTRNAEQILEFGGVAVHELIHTIQHNSGMGWDNPHEFWNEEIDDTNMNLDRLAKVEVKLLDQEGQF